MCVLCLTHKAATSAACHTKAREREKKIEIEGEEVREPALGGERESTLGGEFRAAPFRQSSASPVQLQPTQSVG